MKPCKIVVAKLPMGEKDEVRVSVTPDGQKVDVRRYALLTASSGLHSATADGLSLPVSDIPGLLAGLQSAKAKAVDMGARHE